jgi:hypothetical protein
MQDIIERKPTTFILIVHNDVWEQLWRVKIIVTHLQRETGIKNINIPFVGMLVP